MDGSDGDVQREDTDLVSQTERLLRANGTAWTTMSGRLWSWEDEYLLDLGRARFHGESDTDMPPEADIVEREYRAWATHAPWRLRLDLSWERGHPEDDDEPLPTTTVVDRRSWWTVTEGSFETGLISPDEQARGKEFSFAIYRGEVYADPSISEGLTPGTENLEVLVEPAGLASAFTMHDAEAVEIDGRSGVRVRAIPIEGDAFFLAAPGLAVLSADEYSLTLDVESGIIVAWEAYIDGRVARRQAVRELIVNEPLEPTLFSPPDGRGTGA